MRLFDGGGPDGEAGSTTELAKRTGWPVVLAVDTAGQGASVAALVAGFARHDRTCRSPVSSSTGPGGPRHRVVFEARRWLGTCAELPCLGAIGRDPQLALPSRHLGLIPAGEHDAAGVIGRAADTSLRRSTSTACSRSPNPPSFRGVRSGEPEIHRRDPCPGFRARPSAVPE